MAKGQQADRTLPRIKPADLAYMPELADLQDRATHWAVLLGMTDWKIRVEWMNGREGLGVLGLFHRIGFRREAVILITRPDTISTNADNIFDVNDDLDLEKTLVHEMLHGKFADVETKLFELDGDADEPLGGSAEGRAHHQAIHELAGLLITQQRKIESLIDELAGHEARIAAAGGFDRPAPVVERHADMVAIGERYGIDVPGPMPNPTQRGSMPSADRG